MNNREFVVWLCGFLELCEPVPLNRKTLFIIRNHLNLVKAVAGSLGDFNIQIEKIVMDALNAKVEESEPMLFGKLKQMTQDRLKQLEAA